MFPGHAEIGKDATASARFEELGEKSRGQLLIRCMFVVYICKPSSECAEVHHKPIYREIAIIDTIPSIATVCILSRFQSHVPSVTAALDGGKR